MRARRLLARCARRLAAVLVRVAERLEPRRLEQLATAPSADPEGDAAMRAIGVLQLKQALRRYAPAEERGEA
ncbi:MAG: hypothetical protein QM756_44745 [Polyangiaceae bacterium]